MQNQTHVNTDHAALVAVEFHGQYVITAMHDGQPYVAMKPICENIGLAWNGQWERINRHPVLSAAIRVIRTVAKDGKDRETVCLPLDFLNGWLFGVDSTANARQKAKR